MIFDSGSSYTYFASEAYHTLVSLVRISKINYFIRKYNLNSLLYYEKAKYFQHLTISEVKCILQLTRDLHRTSLKDATDDDTLPVCWKGRRPFKSIRDVKKYFKPLALSFGDGGRYASHYDIPPENYLIISVSSTFRMSLSVLCLNACQYLMQQFVFAFLLLSDERQCLLGNSEWY